MYIKWRNRNSKNWNNIKNKSKDQYREELKFSLLFFIFIIFFVQLRYADSVANEVCDIKFSLSDWRVLSVICLSISALLIACYYMLGHAISDDVIVARARREIPQIIATGIIIAVFIGVVSFICGPIIPHSLGYKSNTLYEGGKEYLFNLRKAVAGDFYFVSVSYGILNAVGALKPSEFKRVEGLIESIEYIEMLVDSLLSTLFAGYMATLIQIQMLDFIQIYVLSFLLPIGIILRSFSPTRRFGGALLGAGIALYIFTPFLLMLNGIMMDKYFQTISSNIKCTQNIDCHSHVCNTTIGICASPLKVGEECVDWMQCESGRCENVNGKWQCVECKGRGEKCTRTDECCKGFRCANNVCVPGLNIDKDCNRAFPAFKECVTWFCNSSNKCAPPLSVGESCINDWECASRRCKNGVCVETSISEGDLVYSVSTTSALVNIGSTSALEAERRSTYDIIISGSGTTLTNIGSTGINPLLNIFQHAIGGIIGSVFLPALNLIILTAAVRSVSEFFGSEIDIAGIWRVI